MEKLEISFEWEWEDEIYNEQSEEYFTQPKTTQVTAIIEIEDETGESYFSAGEPGGIYVEIEWDGDQLNSYQEERVIEYASENYMVL